MLVRLKGNELVSSVYTKIRNRWFGKQPSLGAGTTEDPSLPGTGSNSPGHKGVTGCTEVLASQSGASEAGSRWMTTTSPWGPRPAEPLDRVGSLGHTATRPHAERDRSGSGDRC